MFNEAHAKNKKKQKQKQKKQKKQTNKKNIYIYLSYEIFTDIKASRDEFTSLVSTLYRIRKVSKPWYFDFTADLKNCDNVNVSAEHLYWR